MMTLKPLSRMLGAAAVAFGLSGAPSLAQDAGNTLHITTGSGSGTYTTFARNIAQVLPSGMRLEIHESDGSVENLRRLLGYLGTSDDQYYQLAIVQGDVLEQLRNDASGNPTLEEIVSRIKVVLPLYGEEVHVFASKSKKFRSFEDLLNAGVTVSAGPEASGTYQTVLQLYKLFDKSNLTPSLQNTGGPDAIADIRDELLDALIQVAGAPATLGKGVTLEDGLELLELTLPRSMFGGDSPFREVTVTQDEYSWLDRPVDTIAVNALLVTFDYDLDNPHCKAIERLTRSIINNLDTLRDSSTGAHAKWKQIDLVAARERSDLYACSKRALDDAQ